MANPSINTNRKVIFSSRSSDEVYTELDRLADLFKNVHRRKLDCDLYFSSQGADRENIYSVTVYYGSQLDELAWLEANVKEGL